MDDGPRNESEGGSAPAVSRISRRTFVGAAGALGLTGAAMHAVPASPAGGQRSFLGSNEFPFFDIQQGMSTQCPDWPFPIPHVPGLRGVRIYDRMPAVDPATGRLTNQLASTWPHFPDVGSNGPVVFSIYPLPDTVLGSGSAIPAIETIIADAPPGSYLSAWHEAISNSITTPPAPYNTPAAMKDLHSALNEMCLQNTNVTYGAIFGGDANFLADGQTADPNCPPKSDKPRAWDMVPTDLGFYGIDVYGSGQEAKNLCFLDTFIEGARKYTEHDPSNKGYPRLLVAETNDNVESNRPAWFEAVCRMMATYGTNSIGVLTYWNRNGPLSGPWEPCDIATIYRMQYIISSIF
jgi:hypothetical protein